MICFRDKTFCNSDCVNEDCHRYFGEDEKAAAERWWEGLDGHPPVCFSDFSDTCPEYRKP